MPLSADKRRLLNEIWYGKDAGAYRGIEELLHAAKLIDRSVSVRDVESFLRAAASRFAKALKKHFYQNTNPNVSFKLGIPEDLA